MNTKTNITFRALLLVTDALLSFFTSAGTLPFEGCRSQGCVGVIDNIYLHRDGSIKFPPPGKVLKEPTGDLDCKLGEGVYFTLKQSHPHFKNIYSMLLTAHSANKEVFVRIVLGSKDCQVDYAIIY